jgi:hypothetical protein
MVFATTTTPCSTDQRIERCSVVHGWLFVARVKIVTSAGMGARRRRRELRIDGTSHRRGFRQRCRGPGRREMGSRGLPRPFSRRSRRIRHHRRRDDRAGPHALNALDALAHGPPSSCASTPCCTPARCSANKIGACCRGAPLRLHHPVPQHEGRGHASPSTFFHSRQHQPGTRHLLMEASSSNQGLKSGKPGNHLGR